MRASGANYVPWTAKNRHAGPGGDAKCAGGEESEKRNVMRDGDRPQPFAPSPGTDAPDGSGSDAGSMP
jgi:hypothetical protein